MIVTIKLYDEKGFGKKVNITEGEFNCLEIDFLNLPDINDKVLIQDGDGKGEYFVEYKVYTVNNKLGQLLYVLREKPFENAIRNAIDN
jgi:hypothetical protein